MSLDSFGRYILQGEGYWRLVGKAREALKHHTMHWRPPTTKNYPAPNANDANMEKP